MRVKHFHNWISQIIGLMFRKERVIGVFHSDEARRWSVHSWFCFQTLQLIFLDKDGVWVESALLQPFQTHISRRKAAYLIEIPVS